MLFQLVTDLDTMVKVILMSPYGEEMGKWKSATIKESENPVYAGKAIFHVSLFLFRRKSVGTDYYNLNLKNWILQSKPEELDANAVKIWLAISKK